MRALAQLVLIFLWVFGIYLAQGFASTALAVIVPLWAWYLSIAHLVVHFNLV